MANQFNVCPHCGKPAVNKEQDMRLQPVDISRLTEIKADREYDHRGVPLPRRTRLGGIITPQ